MAIRRLIGNAIRADDPASDYSAAATQAGEPSASAIFLPQFFGATPAFPLWRVISTVSTSNRHGAPIPDEFPRERAVCDPSLILRRLRSVYVFGATSLSWRRRAWPLAWLRARCSRSLWSLSCADRANPGSPPPPKGEDRSAGRDRRAAAERSAKSGRAPAESSPFDSAAGPLISTASRSRRRSTSSSLRRARASS